MVVSRVSERGAAESAQEWTAPAPCPTRPQPDAAYDAVRLRVTPDESMARAPAGGLCLTIVDGQGPASALAVLPCQAQARAAQVFLYHRKSGRLHVAEVPSLVLEFGAEGVARLTSDVASATPFTFKTQAPDAMRVYAVAADGG